PVRPVLRIETFAERLLPSATSWDAFRHEFTESLAASHSRGVVAFKSIAAYRSGLEIQRVDAAEAAAGFDAVRAEIAAGGPFRLTNKPLIDALLWQTLEVASELSMPIQFHVGLGDDDVYLPSSNPTQLRAIFQESRYGAVPIVLLHNYPYVREAAYLASIYPNVYVDLGLTIPLAGPDCPALLRAALGVAPASKVLASSDGHGVPEFQWLAARMWRRALVRVLAEVVDEGVLGDAEATEVAAMVLHATAELIYPE
ncbi:MAG TPA: amidohydrolase family protein, partial [Thermomicrobiaceae bacterium]|nr:amidohydrolase family protein [Thermomicrobiaceae bacterium]